MKPGAATIERRRQWRHRLVRQHDEPVG